MVYSDRPIEGSPKNSTSSVPDHALGRKRRPPRVRRLGDEGAVLAVALLAQVIEIGRSVFVNEIRLGRRR